MEIRVGDFLLLEVDRAAADGLDAFAVDALRAYTGDESRPRIPRFLGGSLPSPSAGIVDLPIDRDLFAQVAVEAERQLASFEEIANHALLLHLARLDRERHEIVE